MSEKTETLGPILQTLILKTLATNLQFSAQYGNELLPEYFDSKPDRLLLQIVKEYQAKYERELNHSTMVEEIDAMADRRGLDSAFIDILTDRAGVIFETVVTSDDYVGDKALAFCRRQAMRKALAESIEIMRDGAEDYNSISKKIDEALGVGAGADMGFGMEELYNIQALYRDKYRPEELIKTGFSTYDLSLKGGMAPGEVHVIMAPPKTGKSTFGCCVGAHNVMVGKNVFHVSLELQAHEILAKYASRLTGMALDDIFDRNSENYKTKINKFYKRSQNLFVQFWVECSVDVMAVRGWISKVRAAKGVKPDLIILDYDDCLLPTTKRKGEKNSYEEGGDIYNDLKALAAYFQCPVLTMAQPNRPAWNKYQSQDLMIDSQDLANSAKKAMKATSISTLNFKKDDDSGYLYMDVVRRGVGNRQIPIQRMLDKAAFIEGHPSASGSSDDEG